MSSFMILGGYSIVVSIPVEKKTFIGIYQSNTSPQDQKLHFFQKKILLILLNKTTSHDLEKEQC